ncbi:MAG: hypothetical protein IJK74_06640 [Bacteroidales bacterium]|nr:hypothetical protein [Bacteroidales bacterium]
MKRISLIVTAIMIAAPLFSQYTAVSTTALDSLRQDLTLLKQKNEDLTGSNEDLKKRVAGLEGLMKILQGKSEAIATRVTETEEGLAETGSSLKETKNGLETQIQQTNKAVSNQDDIIRKKTFWGILVALFVLFVSAIITILLNRKGNAKIEELKSKAEKLNEEIVTRLSSDIVEMQKIASSLGSLSSAGASSQNEQDLIKALADRITFMEMTLYKMDSGIKGYKHLTKSISQMKDNLKANGYELIDMLGKKYSDGLKATVSFDDDETLPEGTRIITKIIKPQINYNGVMIQSAQITVSQNI